MAQHLRIGSVLEPVATGFDPGNITNVVVTNITSAYVEMEYTFTPSGGPAEQRVVVRPWSTAGPLRVLTD